MNVKRLKDCIAFCRRFRVISSGFYLAHFSSDRSHMNHKLSDGTLEWSALPPIWDTIRGPLSNENHNITDYIRMEFFGGDIHSARGCVLDLSELFVFISSHGKSNSEVTINPNSF